MLASSEVIKRVPYVGPVIQAVGLALDTKEIIETSRYIENLSEEERKLRINLIDKKF